MTTTTTERRFRAIDLISRSPQSYPERVTISGSEYAPFMLHVTFADDNTIERVSLSAWRVRIDGRVDIEHDTTVGYTAEPWVESIAYENAPKPVAPGNYARFSERNMTFPPVFSLNVHGTWFTSSGEIARDDLPSTLIAR